MVFVLQRLVLADRCPKNECSLAPRTASITFSSSVIGITKPGLKERQPRTRATGRAVINNAASAKSRHHYPV
jgi:hypothetical protein